MISTGLQFPHEAKKCTGTTSILPGLLIIPMSVFLGNVGGAAPVVEVVEVSREGASEEAGRRMTSCWKPGRSKSASVLPKI